MMKGFQVNEHVAAVAGNIKVRNRVNIITKCQALEYITRIQIVRRVFDIFVSITIVPGALGVFIKSFLMEAGAYGKDTIVEDKEKRKLVLLVRETPLHIGHLRLMMQAAEMGAHILPPIPSFYHQPKTIGDIIDQTIGKLLDFLAIEHRLFKRWGEHRASSMIPN